ncbi:MAG: DUF167 domain-containing protein [Limisphaera sp.]|nr:DUF167 domain-containing protein [Limisphaera sp.]
MTKDTRPGGSPDKSSPTASRLPCCVHGCARGTLLQVKLLPRAARNEIGELRGAHLVIRVTAPPVDEEANRALCRMLAETLQIPLRQVLLHRGHHARQKVVMICDLAPKEVAARLGLGSE